MKAFVQHQYKDSDKMVLQALMPFVELNSKALFTQKVLYNDIVSDRNLSEVDGNADYYQRRLDPKRLRDIKKYIFNSILDENEKLAVSALFPTAMILAVEQEDLPEIIDGSVDIEFDTTHPIYIVDGQHRLMAMRQLYEELNQSLLLNNDEQCILDYLTSYKFNCTILVNFDIWEQGQVFINVNFKQKPVNRSLYYDVYGAEYIETDNPKHLERNKIYLAHQLTRFMNESSESPFYKNIKMLGTGKGYVSQSFFVEALLPLFKETGIWYFDPKSNDAYIDVLDECKSELVNYYKVVANSFQKYWGEDCKTNKINFICKTTGVGAFTRLMSVVHRELDKRIIDELKKIEIGHTCVKYAEAVQNIMEPLISKQDELFGDNSVYGKTGGKGIEDNLFKELLRLLREAGKLKKKVAKKYIKKYKKIKSSFSQLYIARLKLQGINNIENELFKYMSIHLPSEVDALGTHCSIEEVKDLIVSNLLTNIEDQIITIEGTFLCTVIISFDNDGRDSFNYDFPGAFTLQYKKDNGNWMIEEKDSRVFINTDSYYR